MAFISARGQFQRGCAVASSPSGTEEYWKQERPPPLRGKFGFQSPGAGYTRSSQSDNLRDVLSQRRWNLNSFFWPYTARPGEGMLFSLLFTEKSTFIEMSRGNKDAQRDAGTTFMCVVALVSANFWALTDGEMISFEGESALLKVRFY